MANIPFTRILLALPAFLASGCGPIFGGRDDLKTDGGHFELLPGAWKLSQVYHPVSHALTVNPDSTFEECVRRRLRFDSAAPGSYYCARGRYARRDSDLEFRPTACARDDSLFDCSVLGFALGDSSIHADSVLIALRHQDRPLSANVIVEHVCVGWEPGFLVEHCVEEGGPSGDLDLTLWDGRTWLNFERQVDPDSL
jgi:hypothetical protein